MFERLKLFFKRIFGINDVELIEAPKTNEKDEFLESIIIVPNEQKEMALRLQQQYQAGVLDEDTLTDKQYIALSNLYQSQIDSTKQEITEYKEKIEELKKKLA